MEDEKTKLWKVVLSPYMDRQVPTKPPAEGFDTYHAAERWVYKHYGSTAIDSVIDGTDMGCHIVPVKPRVTLIGQSGNAFAILAMCHGAAKLAGWTDEQWAAFHAEATAGNYEHLLCTVQKYFEVD